MEKSFADLVIRTRLKYDWIVLAYGLICVLIQLNRLNRWGDFWLLVASFVFVEIFEASVYRKVSNGGGGYHMLTSQVIDRETTGGFLLLCYVLDFSILGATSYNFFVEKS